MIIDDALLDDPQALAICDTTSMLVAFAQAGAQVRLSAAQVKSSLLTSLKNEKPRSLVILGMGGSGIAGSILQAVAGQTAAIPVLAINSDRLPAWVSAHDLVVAASASGATAETLTSTSEAIRRGCKVVAITSKQSALAKLVSDAGGDVIEIDTEGRMPRACLWLLLTPQLLIADALGLLEFNPSDVEPLAIHLDDAANKNGPITDVDSNAAKSLALEIAGDFPMTWGTTSWLGPVAYRFACQLNENADAPAIWGVLPEAAHNQVVVMDGPFIDDSDALEEIFRDRIEDPLVASGMRLVLLRDETETDLVKKATDEITDMSVERGVLVTTVSAAQGSLLHRLATLITITDFASTYVALITGVDPGPIPFISELKGRIA